MENEDEDPYGFIAKRDGERDLRFDGYLLGQASSEHGSNGQHTRWTEIKIFRTKGEQYVVAVLGLTQWEGEHGRYSAKVCQTPEEVVTYLTQEERGLSWLAKEAIEAAGLWEAAVEAVD